jgi:hypothetical protein
VTENTGLYKSVRKIVKEYEADNLRWIDWRRPLTVSYGVYRYGRPHLLGAMIALKGVNGKRK